MIGIKSLFCGWRLSPSSRIRNLRLREIARWQLPEASTLPHPRYSEGEADAIIGKQPQAHGDEAFIYYRKLQALPTDRYETEERGESIDP